MSESRYSFGNVSGQGHTFGDVQGDQHHTFNAPDTQLQTQVAALQLLLSRHAHELRDPQGASDAVELLQEEAAADHPSPKRLTLFLNSLTTAAGSVTAITEAAAGIRGLF
jgi:Family of unknown function (DUF5955)